MSEPAAGPNVVESPLAKWVRDSVNLQQKMRTYLPSATCDTLDDLADGCFLAAFIADMDPEFFGPQLKDVRRPDGDPRRRQQNLGVLLECVTVYYQEELQTVVLMELPIISAICRDPASESGLASLKKFLQLILGCCVQCAKRESYINHIKSMSSDNQIEMMQEIQSVMDQLLHVPWNSLEEMSQSSLAEQCRIAYEQLNKAVAERDNYCQRLDDVNHERDFLLQQQQMEPGSPATRQPTKALDQSSSKKHFDSVRELKAKIRAMSGELDQKSHMIEDLVAADENKKQKINQLQSKVRQLQLLADETRHLKDDLDIWKAKAMDNDKNKAELARFKERMEDFEYVTKRVEELKEQNKLLTAQIQRSSSAAGETEALQERLVAEETRNRLLSQQIEEMSVQQDQQFEQLSTLQREKLSAESEKEMIERDLEVLREDLEATKKAKLESRPSLAELALEDERVPKAELISAQEQLKVLQRQLSAADLLLKEKTSEAQSQQRLKNNSEQSESKLKMQLEEALARIEKVTSRNDQYKKEVEQLASSESIASKLGDALTKSIALKDERIRVLDDRLNDALTQNLQLKEDIVIYKKHTELLKNTRASNSPQVFKSGRRSSHAAAMGGDMVSEAEQKDSEAVSRLTDQVARANQKILTLEAEIKALKEQLAAAAMAAGEEPDRDASARENREQAMRMAGKLSELESKNADLSSMNSTLAAELESANEQIKFEQNARSRLKEKEVQWQKRAEILGQFKVELEEENADLSAKLKKLLDQNSELILKRVSLKDSDLPLENRASTEYRSRHSARNLWLSSSLNDAPDPRKVMAEKRKRKGFGSRILTKVTRSRTKPKGLGTDSGGETSPAQTPEPVKKAAPAVARVAADESFASPGSERMGIMEFLIANKLPAEEFVKTPAKIPKSITEDKNPVVQTPPETKPTGILTKDANILEFLLTEGRGPSRQGSRKMPKRESFTMALGGATAGTSSTDDDDVQETSKKSPIPQRGSLEAALGKGKLSGQQSTAGRTPVKVKKPRGSGSNPSDGNSGNDSVWYNYGVI